MKEIPLSGSTPDIFSRKPFWLEPYGQFTLAAYRDVQPLGARNGKRGIITYPLVMAAIDPQAGELVYLVAVEIGTMVNKLFLCGFDGDGRHLNFDSWDANASEQDFIARAQTLTTGFLDRSLAASE